MIRAARYRTNVGDRHGDLTLRMVLGTRIQRRIAGRFECSCGNEVVWPVDRVVSGRKAHCGCKTDHRSNLRHGMSHTPEYSSWTSMKGRCLDPNHKDYPRYGGAGVLVYPAWVDAFESFFRDVGPRPNATSLDRIDTRGSYVPGNVRWASDRQQASNRTNGWAVEIDGVVYPSVEEAARAHHRTAIQIVRWCDGFIDPRRPAKQVSPRIGCRRWRMYE